MIIDKTYPLNICGLKRELPIVQVSETLAIASFVIPGDTELIEAAAAALVDKIATQLDFGKTRIDYLVCPEMKAVPLTHAMARIMGLDYIVIRKSIKAYMHNARTIVSSAITTAGDQMLVLDGHDTLRLKNSNIIIIDDVISTGKSLQALEELIRPTNCTIAARAAILLEDGGCERNDFIYLEKLPVFPA